MKPAASSAPTARGATIEKSWRGAHCAVAIVAIIVLAFAAAGRAQSMGDVNCDGKLTAGDAAALGAALFADPQSGCGADVNVDGAVEAGDLPMLEEILDPPPGPIVTYVGVAGANGVPVNPLGALNDAPLFFRSAGFGFKLVIEAKAGPSGLAPGSILFNTAAGDPSRRPDLQIESNRPLGDGSRAICDGGVPAINPPNFGLTQPIANALNDFACNFVFASASSFACTQDQFGTTSFAKPASRAQFCLQVARSTGFADGDTVLTARVRDSGGNLGPPQQLIVRVGSGTPPTFTPQPTSTPFTPQATWTTTPTKAPGSPTSTPVPPVSPTSGNATATPTPTAKRTPASPTPAPTTSPSPSATPTPSNLGPIVTFLGLTRADDTLVTPDTTTPDGVPVFTRQTGSGFSIVVEGKPARGQPPVGVSAYAPAQCTPGAGASAAPGQSPSSLQANQLSAPDLQIEVSQPLGNGSPAVCDTSGPTAGGVPAVSPPSFADTPAIVDALNDLGCRFVNGGGAPCARTAADVCVLFPSGDFGFAGAGSTTQFCGFVSSVTEFPPGDTVVTARLRDQAGNVGAPAQIVVRVAPPTLSPTVGTEPSPTPPATASGGLTATPSATASVTTLASRTPTPSTTSTHPASPTPSPTGSPLAGPVVSFFGITRADGVLVPSGGATATGVPIFTRSFGFDFSLVIEGARGLDRAQVGTSAYQQDLTSLPDLQVEVSNPLGNGSSAVCDNSGSMPGGVPAINPPSFDLTPTIIGAVNDLGCRFVDGANNPIGRTSSADSCIQFPSGEFAFANPTSTIQFCALIPKQVLQFPLGDTVVTARLRDTAGNVGAPAQIVLRVGS